MSMDSMTVWAIVPAAGRSARYGSRDKLAEDLGGRPVLVRTVEALSRRDEIAGVIVAGPPSGTEAADDFRERFAPTLAFLGARVVDGGIDHRWQTVRAALAEVPDDATHVAVHDAARPAIDDGTFDRVFAAAAAGHGAVIPGVAIDATLKRTDAETVDVDTAGEDDLLADAILGGAGRLEVSARRVLDTIDRTDLWAIQTPQVFERELLVRAFAEADPDGTTDDAGLVERLGEPVMVVPGASTNVKVTTPEDLDLVRAILSGRSRPAAF